MGLEGGALFTGLLLLCANQVEDLVRWKLGALSVHLLCPGCAWQGVTIGVPITSVYVLVTSKFQVKGRVYIL